MYIHIIRIYYSITVPMTDNVDCATLTEVQAPVFVSNVYTFHNVYTKKLYGFLRWGHHYFVLSTIR